MNKEYIFFWGDIFSNFHPAQFEIDGIHFESSEQAYMFFKAVYFDDMDTAMKILEAKTPGKCKRLGRKVIGFDDKQWRMVSMDYMEIACFAKFAQNADLYDGLAETTDKILVEASPRDCYWGIGIGADDSSRFDEDKWQGENKLGIVLMDIRKQLCQGV